MINPVLTYLHKFYGDGQFHNLTPIIRQNPTGISETVIHNLHLDGFIEMQEPTAFEDFKNKENTHPIYGRLTEKGMYYMEGNRKVAAIIQAIDKQEILHIHYQDDKGHAEEVALAPYVYGKDSEERAWVWGAVPGDALRHRRFLLEHTTILDEPTSTFTIDRELILSQPRDIEVVAQIPYQ